MISRLYLLIATPKNYRMAADSPAEGRFVLTFLAAHVVNRFRESKFLRLLSAAALKLRTMSEL
jgi:hypothetical protein